MIRLEPASPESIPALLSIFDADGLLQTGTLPLEPDAENLTKWLEPRMSGTFLVIDEESAEPAGYINICGDGPARDIGYYIAKRFSGRGYAVEATRLMLEKARDMDGLSVVKACVFHENPASRRILEKNDFTFLRNCTVFLPARGGERAVWRFEYVL